MLLLASSNPAVALGSRLRVGAFTTVPPPPPRTVSACQHRQRQYANVLLAGGTVSTGPTAKATGAQRCQVLCVRGWRRRLDPIQPA